MERRRLLAFEPAVAVCSGGMASQVPAGPPGLKLSATAPWSPALPSNVCAGGCVVCAGGGGGGGGAPVVCCPASLFGISPTTPPKLPAPSVVNGGAGAAWVVCCPASSAGISPTTPPKLPAPSVVDGGGGGGAAVVDGLGVGKFDGVYMEPVGLHVKVWPVMIFPKSASNPVFGSFSSMKS